MQIKVYPNNHYVTNVSLEEKMIISKTAKTEIKNYNVHLQPQNIYKCQQQKNTISVLQPNHLLR